MPNSANKSFLSPQILFFLAIIAGTLAWEVIASLLGLAGVEIDLTTGPVGFDAGVLSIYMHVNPGTFVGLFLGYRAARAVSAGTASRAKRGTSSGSRRSAGSSRASASGGSGASSAGPGKSAGKSRATGRRGSLAQKSGDGAAANGE